MKSKGEKLHSVAHTHLSNRLITKDDAYGTLFKDNAKLVELTQAIDVLENYAFSRVIKIGVSSAVTSDLLLIYLRKFALLNEVKLELVNGNYDDPIGDIDRFNNVNVDQIVLMPFFDNLLPSFEAQLENLDPLSIELKESQIRQQYSVVFEKARGVPLIHLCSFHRMGKSIVSEGQDAVELVLKRFNNALRETAVGYSNIRIVDTENIVRTLGQSATFDKRFYFRNKAPYTSAYMNELACRIAASSRGFGGYFYKILVLDCDNTLWGGVVGEELLNGIKLDPYEYPGNIYWSVQQEFAALESQGIILAIVSKNNPADVEEVFQKHPNMVLKDAHIAAKKINWTDKPSNLRALANDLNVGLESIIFLDDSSFECEAVRKQLPMVKTLQVPTNLSDYPNIVAEIKSLLLAGGLSTESKNKTEQYRQRAEAEELKVNFETQEEYLASLKIKVELMRNARASIGRISERSQKSNQFNLTTRRYTIAEIEQLIESGSYSVYSLVVGDKFGNAGLTGVAVMRYENDLAIIENFFMSCRVIGRGIETSIWGHIVTDVIKRGCSKLSAVFIPSNKNEQVSGFYNSLGLQLTMECDGALHYTITSADFVVAKKSWIEIAYVE